MKAKQNNSFKTKKEFSAKGLKYFANEGISKTTLKKYNVVELESYVLNDKTINQFEICFAYPLKKTIKLYQPLSNKYKYMYLTKPKEEYLFGLEQLQALVGTDDAARIKLLLQERRRVLCSSPSHSENISNCHVFLQDWLQQILHISIAHQFPLHFVGTV